MGPESVSLAHGMPTARLRRRLRFTWLAASIGALAALTLPVASQGAMPELTEQARVHRVQIDVSVIDPRGDRWASVPGLTRDMFKIRVDGLPVTRPVDFDEICPGEVRAGRAASPGPGEVPTILVLADLNFLDVGMRFNVRQAIEDLADMAEKNPLRVKVLAFSRRLIPLMPDFSRDPAEIRRAAAALTEVLVPGPSRARAADSTTASLLGEDAPDRPFDLPPELRDTFGRNDPPDPERPRPALQIAPGLEDVLVEGPSLVPPQLSPLSELAQRDTDPRPSLAALEAVMLSHAAIRGRKALVLFSSAWFDMPEQLWLSYLEGPRHAAQSGYTIWSVDARGLAGADNPSTHYSRLLGQIANSSGGEAIRSAGRLAVSFERAISHLSCYYLFSVPVDRPERGVEHHTIDVRLDTARYPDFWHYRIRSPGSFTLLDPVVERQRLRLAALMEPQGYAFPEIRVTAGYASGDEEYTVPVEVSLLLSDLTFIRHQASGNLQAEFSWEGVVSSERGAQLCLLGDGRRRVVRTDSPPLEKPPTLLVLRSYCRLPGPGLYDLRVVLEDLLSGDVGAGTALVDLAAPAGDLASFSAIRLGRNSGRDFLLEMPLRDAVEVPRDRERRAFSPLRADEAMMSSERLLVRYVACNTDGPARLVLYRKRRAAPEGQSAGPRDTDLFEPLFQIFSAPIGSVSTEDARCSEHEGAIPEDSLPPGRYGLAFFDPSLVVGSREELTRLLSGGRSLAFVEFEVEAGRPPDSSMPQQQALAESRR
jgi:VWFA-related protein